MSRIKIGSIVLVLAFVVATPAFGQQSRKMVGFSVGATSGDLQGGLVNTDARWGFTGGVFGAVRTSRNSVVGIEVNYVQKGGKDLARLDYIEIPFLVGALAENDKVKFNFYTGIGLAFKVGCSLDEQEPIAVPLGVSADCDDANSTEWAWPIGIGLAVRNANGGLIGLDTRYSVGLSDTFKGSAVRNRSWQFRLYYGVPMG